MLNIANAAAVSKFSCAPAARSAALIKSDADSPRHIADTLRKGLRETAACPSRAWHRVR